MPRGVAKSSKRVTYKPGQDIPRHKRDDKTTAQVAQAAGRPKDYEDTLWYAHFLNALRKKPNVTAACKAARIHRRTAYNHREKNEEFAKDWDDAIQEGIDVLEEAHWEAGLNGDTKAREYLLQKYRYGGVAPGAKKKEEKPSDGGEVTITLGKRK